MEREDRGGEDREGGDRREKEKGEGEERESRWKKNPSCSVVISSVLMW